MSPGYLVSIKDLTGELTKLAIGAPRIRVLILTEVHLKTYEPSYVNTSYIDIYKLESDSATMTFINKHLPSGSGCIDADFKQTSPCVDYRWFTRVNGEPVDYENDDDEEEEEEEEDEPTDVDALVEEIKQAATKKPPPGFVEFMITVTLVDAS